MRAKFDANNDDRIALGWAGSTTLMDYLNFEDAISPVITAMVGGRSVRRVPAKSHSIRMSAVGAIGHTFEAGEIHVWGSGCSKWKNPSAPAEQRVPFTPPSDGKFVLHATSGPIAESLLSGGKKGPGLYGDPTWLLSKFYRPKVKKKWKVGVILHGSELEDRTFSPTPLKSFRRYEVPAELKDDVHLITMVTPLGVASLKDKIDEILSCERLVSMTMHGLILAETYGIPALYFAPYAGDNGVGSLDLDPDGNIDLRIVDYYLGLKRKKVPAYFQDRLQPTDWAKVISAIDRDAEFSEIDKDALLAAFPFGAKPLKVPGGKKTIWDHPIIRGLQLQHDVAELRRADQEATGIVISKPAPEVAVKPTKNLDAARLETAAPSPILSTMKPAVANLNAIGSAEMNRIEAILRMNADKISIPLSWAATTSESSYANFGDTLSALVVGGMAGLPVRRAGFDQAIERMVAVGTIGHNQKNGVLHFWGTGVDAERNPVDPSIRSYVRPPNTEFFVHATRGPNSAQTFRDAGIDAPAIYGDPVWVLPRFWPMQDVEKTHDLGVILHITELDGKTPEAQVKEVLRRYAIPEKFKGRIKLINTYCEPTAEGMKGKVAEIVSCRAIVSTSLHGLVISETYGIPCAWFATYGEGEGRLLELGNKGHQIDHRMRDFYSGAGRETLASFCLERSRTTDWDKVLDFVHSSWKPLSYDDKPLINAFPMPLAVSADDKSWTLPSAIVDRIEY